MGKTNIQQAFAKINLGLDVTGRREDGYHLVRMVMQTIGLHDTVNATLEEGSGIEMTCTLPGLPTDESNLCVKAARRYTEVYGNPGLIRIHLEKRIPMAAGMAGGSTDAAAVLRALRELTEHYEITDEALEELSVPLGADIPYCIRGGTVLCEGIGEVMTRDQNHSLPRIPVLIAKPDFPVSTPEVYRALDQKENYRHPPIDTLWEKVGSGRIEEYLGNVLQEVTIPLHPEIAVLIDTMKENGACGAMMSGSGPTVFGLFRDKDKMRACAEELRKPEGLETVAETETMDPREVTTTEQGRIKNRGISL